jgi:FkbM family methyltransferase
MANFAIKEILGDKAPMVTVVDIGAMIEGKNRYDGLVEQDLAQVIGFEPEAHEFEKLKAQADKRHAYLPYFVGSGKPGTFHRCRYNGCSSLYEPDPRIIDLFTAIGASAGGNFEVLETSEVQTVRLDDIKEIQSCDFLKVDVQGAELDVLKGATRTLGKTTVVELEVEFVPLYKDQPLFAEIDIFMRANGFLLHKFHEVAGRAMRPFLVDNDLIKPLSQLLWANAVYIKDVTRFTALPPDMLLKTAAILHEVYASFDMAAFALKAYDLKAATHYHERYMARATTGARIEYSFMKFV